jgi:hypothetical protein
LGPVHFLFSEKNSMSHPHLSFAWMSIFQSRVLPIHLCHSFIPPVDSFQLAS